MKINLRHSAASLVLFGLLFQTLAPGLQAADSFKKVEWFKPVGDKFEKLDAALEFGPEGLTLASRGGKEPAVTFPYNKVSSVTYSRGKNPVARLLPSRQGASLDPRAVPSSGAPTGPVFNNHEVIKYQVIIATVIVAAVVTAIILIKKFSFAAVQPEGRQHWLVLNTADGHRILHLKKKDVGPILSELRRRGVQVSGQ